MGQRHAAPDAASMDVWERNIWLLHTLELWSQVVCCTAEPGLNHAFSHALLCSGSGYYPPAPVFSRRGHGVQNPRSLEMP